MTNLFGTFILLLYYNISAYLLKFFDGGWFPLLLAILIFLLMMTWKKGRKVLQTRIQEETQPLEEFLQDIAREKPIRVLGTAVFMNGNASRTPSAIIHNLEHNKILHQRVLFVTVKTRPIPYVPDDERLRFEIMGNGFVRIKIYYGYMEDPQVPNLLATINGLGFVFKPEEATYFLGRETIISTGKYSGMAKWRENLFALLSKNARSATAYFGIPADRVVELGEQIEI